MNYINRLLEDYDKLWRKRHRSLDTKAILYAIANSAYNRHGIVNVADDLGVTPSALCRAQQRLPIHAFRDIQHQYVDSFLQSSRIFALDGSKFYVPKSFTRFGFKSRTNGVSVPRCAKRPIAMLSVLVDVHNKSIYTYAITKHFNERSFLFGHLATK